MAVKKLSLVWFIGASLYVISSLSYGVDQTIKPSPALLNLVGVSTYKISEDIRLKVTKDDIKSPRGISVCDTLSFVPLFLSSKITGVTTIKAAAETASFKQQAMLFSIHYYGGVSNRYMYNSLSLNLDQYHEPDIMNIWVFYFTDESVFANFVRAQCVLKDVF